MSDPKILPSTPNRKKRPFLVSCVVITSDKIQNTGKTDQKPKAGYGDIQTTESQEDRQPGPDTQTDRWAGRRMDVKTNRFFYGQAAVQATAARAGYHTIKHLGSYIDKVQTGRMEALRVRARPYPSIPVTL